MFNHGSKAFVKGLYQADSDLITDECFGTWMVDKRAEMHEIEKRGKADFFGLSNEDFQKWGAAGTELVFGNIDKCGIRTITDDLKGWCMEDLSRCIYMKGIENRLVENGVEIIGTLVDLAKLMMEDDTCFTHQEQIGAATRFYKDIGELFSYLSGFDYKFDKVNMPKHIKKSTIKTAIHAFRKRDKLTFE